MIDPALFALDDELKQRADPIAYFRCSSEGQERVAEYFAQGIETYAHAAERAGKSKIGIACWMALAQGQPGIFRRDGSLVRFPRLQPAVTGVVAFDTYKLGGAAFVKTLFAMLGDWEHERGPNASHGCPAYVDIRHVAARNRSEWSRVWFFPYDGVLPRSMELDFWHCDEPPPIAFLEALTARVAAFRPAPRGVITATPLDENAWAPIKLRYPERECAPEEGRVRVRWSVFDNEALPDTAKATLKRNARGSIYELAKLYGHHVSADGGNPWPAESLQRLMDRTRPPLNTERLFVQKEVTGEGGKHLEEVACDLLLWQEPVKGDPYYIVGDPAKGISDGRHDPDGLQVWNRRARSLVAEIDGYLGGWGLGNAMVKLARRYNDAVCDPLVTGGYGEALLSAIRVQGYGNLTHDRIETRPGHWQNRVGTTENHELRGKIVGAVERAVLTGQCDIPSASVIACLMKVRVKDGKVQAIGRGHDEKMICAGRALLYLGEPPREIAKPIREEKPKILTMADIMRAQGGVIRKPNSRRTLENVSGP